MMHKPPLSPEKLMADIDRTLDWRLLKLLNIVRLGIIGLLMALQYTEWVPRTYGLVEPNLFLWTGFTWLGFALLSVWTLRKRQPPLAVQATSQIAADIVGGCLLLYASGGITSGLGNLLFVFVAGGSLVLGNRLAVLFAAIASLALLGIETYLILDGLSSPSNYSAAALLGTILFITALAGNWLAKRMRSSEALAIRRGVDLQNVSQLNDYIIEQLTTGVLVLDGAGALRQINAAAAQYLGLPPHSRGRDIAQLAPALAVLVADWRRNPKLPPSQLAAADGGQLAPRLTPLQGGVLIFLEDARAATERTQRIKLAALGRLSASIAHEIRNPLSAISHASQLLGEAPQLDAEQQRLLAIIDEHASRVNIIIENILQLSRREQTRPEKLDLENWLHDLREEFSATRQLPAGSLMVSLPEGAVATRVDPRQLHQVVWNLLDNAVKYAGLGNDGLGAELRAGQIGDGQAYLELEDQGPGVATDIAEQIFEPFYSAGAAGSGLGLFIARELCELNRASLAYRPSVNGGGCFRITFAHPQRWVD